MRLNGHRLNVKIEQGKPISQLAIAHYLDFDEFHNIRLRSFIVSDLRNPPNRNLR